jgi:prolyl-tRNA editing enzyme YbaK/EbsC (Cys-tRNA(Pro) deacylase)
MTPALTPADLQRYLDTHALAGEILHLDVPTPTVETAAQAVGAHPDQIVKSVLFLIEETPILAVAYGTAHIDRRGIADKYGVGRKRVKLADAETVLRFTGYPAGAVPPFGHPHPLPTLLDPGVLQYEQVYAGGGAGNALVRLNPHEILRVTGAELVPLLENGKT